MMNTAVIETIQHKLDPNKKPVYKELAAIIAEEIATNKLPKGSKLPPYRILSWKLGVAEGTVLKAYRELERNCLIVPRIGDGSYVHESTNNDNNRFRNAPINIKPENLSGSHKFHDLSRNQSFIFDDMSKWRDIFDLSKMPKDDLYFLLNYTDEQGLLAHRQAGAKWLNIDIDPKHIVCTNGAQHALQISLKAVMRSQESIAVDEYTYPGILSLAKHMNIRIISIKMDKNGLCPDDLAKKFNLYRFSAIFLTPTIHNPTNSAMPETRRDVIADFCKSHGVFILEDETQGMISKVNYRSFFDRLPAQTILLASVSKCLSSGLRAGYLVAPEHMLTRIRYIVQEICHMATPLSHEYATRCITNGYAQEHMDKTRNEIMRRKEFVNEALEGVEYYSLDYSAHYWFPLPAKSTDTDVVATLRKKNILVSPSSHFCSKKVQDSYFIRTCVTAHSSDDDLFNAYSEIRKLL